MLDRRDRRRKFVLQAYSCMRLIYERITRSNVRDALSSRLLHRDRSCGSSGCYWSMSNGISCFHDRCYALPGKKRIDNVITKYIENLSLESKVLFYWKKKYHWVIYISRLKIDCCEKCFVSGLYVKFLK